MQISWLDVVDMFELNATIFVHSPRLMVQMNLRKTGRAPMVRKSDGRAVTKHASYVPCMILAEIGNSDLFLLFFIFYFFLNIY